jgi:DNA-binding MarR family transcriptional regulator
VTSRQAARATAVEPDDPAALLTDVVPRLYRVLRAALDEDPALPSLEQLRVMGRIDEGVRHASALAAARQMRISAITPLIDGLAARGWVTRHAEPGDRRRVRLELTGVGEQALAAGRRRTADRLREVLRHGDSEEATTDVATVAAWLEQAVRRYDADRLRSRPSTPRG